MLLLVKLQVSVCKFTNSNTPLWVFFTFFKLHKWYQVMQSVSYVTCINLWNQGLNWGKHFAGSPWRSPVDVLWQISQICNWTDLQLINPNDVTRHKLIWACYTTIYQGLFICLNIVWSVELRLLSRGLSIVLNVSFYTKNHSRTLCQLMWSFFACFFL